MTVPAWKRKRATHVFIENEAGSGCRRNGITGTVQAVPDMSTLLECWRSQSRCPGRGQNIYLVRCVGAEYVIISKVSTYGRDALELVFEDGSDAPFVIHMLSEQCDRLPPENNWRGFCCHRSRVR